MSHLTTPDGVRLGYDHSGTGPAVILVDAAFQYRAGNSAAQELLRRLAKAGLSVWYYDRRGRGESAAEGPFTLDDEISDLRTVIAAAGGRAALFGSSSGGAIALAAAAAGLPVTHLALWEVPLGPELGSNGAEFLSGLRAAIAQGDPDAVVTYYMKDMPPQWLAGAKVSGAWPGMTAMAGTLEADAEALAWAQSAPRPQLFAKISVPVVAMYGQETLPLFAPAAESIASAVVQGTVEVRPGRHHAFDVLAMAERLAALVR